MNMTAAFKSLLALFVFVAISAISVNAQYDAYGQYGTKSTSQSIVIDKMVGLPTQQTKGGVNEYAYTDNLSAANARFRAGQTVAFQIKVKNVSNQALNDVTVKDILPAYLEPMEGPGTYDANSRVISFNAGNFAAGEEKIYYIKTTIFPQDKMPVDKGLFCLVNKAQAFASNTMDEDTAEFCIEKEVLGVSQVPSAGPEMGLLLLGGQLSLLGAGIILRKKVA